MRFWQVILISLGLSLTFQTSWAEKAYVTNTSRITLRKGPGVGQKILTMLHIDQPVEVLGSKAGWSRIRLLRGADDSLEGWVLSRFLTQQVPWKIQAKSLAKENSLLKERLARLEKDRARASSKEKELSTRLREHTEALKELQGQYNALRADSSDFLELRKEYEAAQKALAEAKETAKTLRKENESLKSSHRNEWFATGASVLFVGLIFGLIMGRQQRRRRSSYY